MLGPIKFFSVYSRKDKMYLEEFKKNLAPLIRDKVIEFWHDQEIKPGEVWESIIKIQLAKADIIILLVSSDFLSSDFINSSELPDALKRREKEEVEIIPIIVRNCFWQAEKRISQLQVIPPDALPIAEWDYKDRAYTIISQHLIEFIDKIRIKKAFLNNLDFDLIHFYSEEQLYNFFIGRGEHLITEMKYQNALYFLEKAKIKYKEKYSISSDYLNKRINECKYNESISMGHIAMSSKEYLKAIQHFENALPYYLDSFTPVKPKVESYIIDCKMEVYRTNAQSSFIKREIEESLEIINKGLALNKNDQNLRKIKKEVERYKVSKNNYQSLLSEAQSYEHINWPEALKRYKESAAIYFDDFQPDINYVKEKVIYCEQEIQKIQENALKTQWNQKKFQELTRNAQENFDLKDFKNALEYYEESLKHYENSFTPDRNQIKEKIMNIENVLFLQHKEKVLEFHNEKKYKEALDEYKTAILYQSDDIFYTALHKLIDNEENFFNQLEKLVENNKNIAQGNFMADGKISKLSEGFVMVFLVSPFFAFFYVLITYCFFYQALNFPYLNFFFTLVYAAINTVFLDADAVNLTKSKRVSLFLLSSFLSIYLTMFLQFHYLLKTPLWKVYDIGQILNNIHVIVQNCYVGYWSFIFEIFTLLIVPLWLKWEELMNKGNKL